MTVRDWTGTNPIRIVLDKESKLNKELSVFDSKAETIRITEKDIDFNKNIGFQISNLLYKRNINSIIIEGGAKTLQTFIDENLWDEARIFIGSTEFNGGIKAPTFSGKLISETFIEQDILRIYTND